MVAELIIDLHVKDAFCMCQDKREMSLDSFIGKRPLLSVYSCFNGYAVLCLREIKMDFLIFGQALFCVRGRELLYRYCYEHGVPCKQIGKLIVATGPLEISKLNELMDRGTQNGVDNLKMLEGFEAMKMEPELQCKKALLSPVSGIVDSHSLMLSLVVCVESFYVTF
jgi:hypothetical protein